MIKTLLKYSISFPIALIFICVGIIVLYIVFGIIGLLMYVISLDKEIVKYVMDIPNEIKDNGIVMLKDVFFN